MMKDIYTQVTDSIIEMMESAEHYEDLTWNRSVHRIPQNAVTGRPYSGCNVLLLWASMQERGYTQSLWGTYKQFKEAGYQVRRGEKSTLVVYFKPRMLPASEGVEIDENDPDTFRVVPLARAYYLFNVEQVDGWPEPEVENPAAADFVRHDNLEQMISATGAVISIGGDDAYYRPSTDRIHMPHENRFQKMEDWYAVLLHELTHWTGHHSRLDRLKKSRFGSETYAFEELVAELGSAFLCAHYGLETVPRSCHAKYLKSWIKVLKNDKRAIFTASSMAGKAADYILGLAQAVHNKAA